ncbi:hypothetical protein [Vibrio sp. V15_P4S5T153]
MKSLHTSTQVIHLTGGLKNWSKRVVFPFTVIHLTGGLKKALKSFLFCL